MFHGEQGGGGPGGDPRLGVDVLYVGADGFGGDAQLAGGVFVGTAAGDEPQHVDFAFGQAGRAGDVGDGRGVACGGEHGVDRGPGQPAGVRLGGEDPGRLTLW